MREYAGGDVQEEGLCWSDAPGREPRIGPHLPDPSTGPSAPGEQRSWKCQGLLRKEGCSYRLKFLAPSPSSQLPDLLPKSCILHPTAAGQPAQPPLTREATAKASTPCRGTRRSPPLGGLQEKQEAASAPWEGSWLPGKIQLTVQGKSCLPDHELLECRLRLHLPGLAQQRCSVEIQRINEYHS